MRFRSLLLGGFLIAALSLPAQQDEGATYFSLRQDRPVRPGETANVQMHASGLDEIQFRLYRVNEPLTFVSCLEAGAAGQAAQPRARAVHPGEPGGHPQPDERE